MLLEKCNLGLIRRYILTREGHLRRHGQILNLLRYRLSKKSVILGYQPVNLSVASTSRCNLNCDMCHTHSRYIGDFEFSARPTKDVDFTFFKDFVNKFNKAVNISIIGSGEPLLNKDFFKMIDYAARVMRMDVSTTTNGTLLDEKTIERIIESGLSSIDISVDGDNEEESDRMTGISKEIYREKLKNIKCLVSKKMETNSKLDITLSFIIDKENYKKIPSMIKLGEKLGVDSVAFINFLPSPFPGFTTEERCITTDNTDAINLINTLKANRYDVRVALPIPLNLKKRKICTSHFTTLRVDGDGNIGGCAGILLNLEKNGKWDDKEVWNNEYFQKMRGIFLDQKEDRRLEPCKVCVCSSA